jgi:hypothetical protein
LTEPAIADHLAELMWQREYVFDLMLRFGRNIWRLGHHDALVFAIDQLGAAHPDAIAPALVLFERRVRARRMLPRTK